MNTANDVVQTDLDYICAQLSTELPRLSGKRLLITGGAGFLGYYMVQALLHWNQTREGASIRVCVLDNFVRGVPEWLAGLEGDTNLSILRQNITEPLPVAANQYEFIVHAASIASPIYYRAHPIETMDANVDGLRILLDQAVANKTSDPVEGFLFFSTSEIYGDPTPENIPTPETYRGNVSCTGPRACYDESKRYGETLCVNFAQEHGLPVRMARPFNNYGPGLKITDGRALPDFARNVLEGNDIVLLSDGAPTRTFCYVADAVVGYFKILIRGADGEAYNIGTDGPEIAIRTLAEMVIEQSRELFGYQGKLRFGVSEDRNYLVDNPNRRCPVIDKARMALDYEPGVELEDGIRRALVWYRDNRQAEEK